MTDRDLAEIEARAQSYKATASGVGPKVLALVAEVRAARARDGRRVDNALGVDADAAEVSKR